MPSHLPIIRVLLLGFLLAACGAPGSGGPVPVSPVPTASPAAISPQPAPPTPTQPAPAPTTAAPPGDDSGVAPTVTPPGQASELPPTSPPVYVTALPDPTGYAWRLVASGLDSPVGLAHAGDGSGRLFVLEQKGLVRVLLDGQVQATPFLDLSGRVTCCGERGLLGLAFHPQYEQNGYFYANYTATLDGELHTVIARFSAPPGVEQADPGSEVRLMLLRQPYSNHNGGHLAFGPDGYLYAGQGDGGAAGDPQGNAQSLDTWLGKILRLDVDQGSPYAIPPDNPFASGGGLPEIWLSGLRNPWRFSFDRLTGDLYIGDVGQGAWEEIDFLPAGSPGGGNLGWDYFEGTHSYEGSPAEGASFIAPVAEYPHDPDFSVTGGVVYRGAALPEWWGVYLYGDYMSGNVWGLLRSPDGAWQNALLFTDGVRISSFGEDEAGEVYLVDHTGNLYRLERDG